MLALPQGAAETGADGVGSRAVDPVRIGRPGRNLTRCSATPIGPDARAAAAVRDAKCFVQIQMANVGADVARPAETDLRVHVRAVHVNLAAVLMNDLADLPDSVLEDAVRGRIGDHQRGQILAVRRRPWRGDPRDRCCRLRQRDRHDLGSRP